MSFDPLSRNPYLGPLARPSMAFDPNEQKCGTCRHFEVRPPEVEIARAAKPMSACGPGQYCYGGPVRGTCRKHRTMAESTGRCPSWQAGGPAIRGATVGSANTGPRPQTANTGSGVDRILSSGGEQIGEAEIARLPKVIADDLRTYPYRRLPGGQRVAIYLPTGVVKEHRVSSLAARDDDQLRDEVISIVHDSFLERGRAPFT